MNYSPFVYVDEPKQTKFDIVLDGKNTQIDLKDMRKTNIQTNDGIATYYCAKYDIYLRKSIFEDRPIDIYPSNEFNKLFKL